MNAALRNELISDTQSLLERHQRPVHILEIRTHLESRGFGDPSRIDILPVLTSVEAKDLFEPDLDPATGVANGFWVLRSRNNEKPVFRIALSERDRERRADTGVACPSCDEVLASWVRKPSGPLSPGARWAACDHGCELEVADASAPTCPYPGCGEPMRIAKSAPDDIPGTAWRCECEKHFELTGAVKK